MKKAAQWAAFVCSMQTPERFLFHFYHNRIMYKVKFLFFVIEANIVLMSKCVRVFFAYSDVNTAPPLRKAAEAKGTAQKGHKALAQGADAAQSGRTQARDPQCAGAHRFARCRLHRAPGSLKLRFPQHKMTEPRADCPWL